MPTEAVNAQPLPAAAPTLRQAFAVQRRVIGALILREVITRFGRHNLGAMWLVAEPMLFTLGVAALWSAAGLSRSSAIPVVAFAVTGYSSVLMWRNTVGRCSHAIQANLNLLFHRNVRVIDVLLARILLEIGGSTASFMILVALFSGIEWMALPQDPLSVVFAWLMLAWFGVGLSLTMGGATAFSPIIERLWHPAAYLLFPLSGAAYMVDWLAPAARPVLLMLPMVHAVELLREGFFGDVVTYHHDMGYMAVCNLVLTLLGLWLVRLAGNRVEAE